jgi:glycyl-tRNA synthetase beta chain
MNSFLNFVSEEMKIEVDMETLLLEIGTEEIPAGYIEPALASMSQTLLKKMTDLRIDHGSARVFGTPRRLAVEVKKVALKQTPLSSEVLGPPEKIGFDQKGRPTMAATKFAEKVGVSINALSVKETDKGRYVCARVTEKGQATKTLLKTILPEVILATPFPKTMIWAELNIYFARPIHSIVALFGDTALGFSLEDIKSGRYSYGHYFMHPRKIKISSPKDYIKTLRSAKVLVDLQTRKKSVEKEIHKAAKSVGGEILPDDELVDIVKNLVEYPFATAGSFDKEFLKVPGEVLITAMREHQKYFAVVDKKGNLMPCFVAVEKLKGVLFQAKLGSMHEKVKRLQKMAGFLADNVEKGSDLKKHAARAAWLSKADLVSQVVGEFPKLQGIMGRVYATVEKEPKSVASAIEEHYRPIYSGGALPKTMGGAILGIADKIDNICGFFSVGLTPTGASDPYALRRQGIGIIQIMIDKGLSFSLRGMIEKSIKLYGIKGAKKIRGIADPVNAFLNNRLTHLLAEEGFSKDVIAAVTSVSADNIPDLWNRARALQDLKTAPDFEPLAVAFKRVVNIIKKAKTFKAKPVKESLFEHDSEKALYAKYKTVKKKVSANLDKGNLEKALHEIASLKDAVDSFFDGVLVMSKEKKIRNNRLSLLSHIADLFETIADFSKIST